MNKSELTTILHERNLFRVLGLEASAPPEEIHVAYKKLAKQAHPDLFSASELKSLAEQTFVHINNAYNVLRDPFKRQEYERTLQRTEPTPPAPTPSTAPQPEQAKAAPPADEKARTARRQLAETHFTTGLQYERKNLPDDAIREYQEAIRLANDVAKYHSHLGIALQKKDWKGYAQAEFKVALHFDPTDKIALKNYQPSGGQSAIRGSLGMKLLNMFKAPGQSNRIGDILIQQGHLKKDQLQQALKKQSDEKLLLGEILIRMKYIKPEHLAQALIHQGETLSKES
jgi:molecular chaperone DnaJ